MKNRRTTLKIASFAIILAIVVFALSFLGTINQVFAFPATTYTINNSGEYKFVLETNTSMNLSISGTNGVKNALVGVNTGRGNYSALLTFNFSQTIDASNITTNTSKESAKSYIHNSSAITSLVSKSLLVPRVIGSHRVYICQGATNLDQVYYGCSGMKIIDKDQSIDGMLVTEVVYDQENYYLISNITGTGGGEANIPVMNTSRINPSLTAYDYQNLTGYCNATDADNDSLFYNYKWLKDGIVYYQGIAFKNGSVSAGGYHTCAIRANDSRILCWGQNTYGQLGTGNTTQYNNSVEILDSSPYSYVETGLYHTCGIRANDSRVLCWGYNNAGQLGIGNQTDYTFPVAVANNTAYKSLHVGYYHNCGIRANDSTMLCWGLNNDGQLGTGTYITELYPTPVNSSAAYTTVSLGYIHTCAIRSNDSRVMCWGNNSWGQLGTGTTVYNYNPTLINDSTQYHAVSGGRYHTCALRANDSRAVCWGDNTYATLGNGSSGGYLTNPTPTIDSTQYITINPGRYHTCAIRANDSKIMCWGRNDYGQLGTGNLTNSPIATLTNDTSSYIWVDAGYYHTCGIRANDSKVLCWGYNQYGELGIGNTTYSNYSLPITDSSSYAGRFNQSIEMSISFNTHNAYTSIGQNWVLSCQAFDGYNTSTWMNSPSTNIVNNLSSCGILNTSNTIYYLDTNLTTNGTCLTINANNITIDGQGHTITYANNATLGYGIYIQNYNNTNISNLNIIQGNSTTSSKHAIYLYKSSNNTINNINLTTTGTSAYGTYLNSYSSNNTINNININTNGTNTYGTYLNSYSSNNRLNNINITSQSSGIYLATYSSNNIITNISINSLLIGIYPRGYTNNNTFINGIINSGATGILFFQASYNIFRNISINSNTTDIWIYATSFQDCNNSIDSTNTASGKPVNYTLNANNIVLDAQNNSNYGQYIFALANNITITNNNFTKNTLIICNASNITITNNNLNMSGEGIDIFFTTDTVINNNNIISRGDGIYLYSSTNNKITNTNISTSGTQSYGTYLNSYSSNNTINNINIITNGSQAHGIYIYSNSRNNNITNTNIKTEGNSSDGIYIWSSSTYNQITNMNITTIGTDSHGIRTYFTSPYTNITNVNITTTGSQAHGIFFRETSTNNIINTIIETTGDNSSGIILNSSISNFLSDLEISTLNASGILIQTSNQTVIINPNITTTNWAINDTTDNSYSIYLKFINSFGEITWTNNADNQFLKNLTITHANLSLNDAYVQIKNNSVFLNSTYYAGGRINSSANITLYGLGTFTSPVIYRDDTNICNSTTTPSCYNFTSLNAGTVRFNVSSWSNYSIGEGSITYSFSCDEGDLTTTCNITTNHAISDATTINAVNMIIKPTGSLYNNTANCSGTNHGCGFTLNLTGNLTIQPNGNITAGNITIIGQNVDVQANQTHQGKLNTDGLGWMELKGTGASLTTVSAANYGGTTEYTEYAYRKLPYGNPRAPSDFGSGGATKRGGGIVFINASETINISGIVTSKGISPGSYEGGGAGGSIWLAFNNIVGTGLIIADGGYGTGSGAQGGGGGRIYFDYITDIEYQGGVSANGRTSQYTLPHSGTFAFKNNIWPGNFISNNKLVNFSLPGGNYTILGDFILNATDRIEMQPINFTEGGNGSGIKINVTGNVVIAGTIDGSMAGFFKYGGPGDYSLRGGTYAGKGAGYALESPSTIYGDEFYPRSLGSNGDGGSPGGGAIEIISNNITISGIVNMNGRTHVVSDAYSGSGGSILLRATQTINITGNVTSQGGSNSLSAANLGVGGGGRIAIHAMTLIHTGNISASGGTSGHLNNTGNAGTIYINTTNLISTGEISAQGYRGTTGKITIKTNTTTLAGIYGANSTVNPQGNITLNFTNCFDSSITGTFYPTYSKSSCFILTNPNNAKYVATTNTSINLSAKGQTGIASALVGTSTSKNHTAIMYFNFNQDIDVTNITTNTSRALAKSFIHNSSSITGLINISLLIPKVSSTNRVYICPGAIIIDQVNQTCTNMITVQAGQSNQGMTVTTTSIDNEQYYLVTNITGTGGGEWNYTEPTIIQYTNATAGDDLNLTLQNVSDNSLIIVGVAQSNSAFRSYSIYDTSENTYELDAQADHPTSGRESSIFSAKNVTGGNITITINISVSGVTYYGFAMEVRGADQADPLDTFGTNITDTAENQHICSTEGMNTSSNVLILCIGGLGASGITLTPGINYTKLLEPEAGYIIVQNKTSANQLMNEYGYWNSSQARSSVSAITVYKSGPTLNRAPTQISARISSTPTAYDYQNLTGYCNATDADNDSIIYQYTTYKNENYYESDFSFKSGGLSVGNGFTCGIRANDSALTCWGRNDLGQLGNGTTGNAVTSPQLSNTTAFSEISSGDSHSCGIRINDSRIMCWGLDTNGQLGDGGAAANKPSPVNVNSTVQFEKITTGSHHTCAINKETKKIYCWGRNDYGQIGLGNMSYGTNVYSPTQINDSSEYIYVAAGMQTTCAIRANDSRMLCWGYNQYGQLGDGTTTHSNVSKLINTSAQFNEVKIGYEHVCAIRANDSRAMCWGSGGSGQLGTGLTTTSRNPVNVNSTAAFINLGLSAHTSCGIQINDSRAMCWGYNSMAQIADGTYNQRNNPWPINDTSKYYAIDGTQYHTCGIRESDRTITCWGYNLYGEIGNGSVGGAVVMMNPNQVVGSYNYIQGHEQGIEINIRNISHYSTLSSENWTLSCQANDGYNTSSWMNSSATQILADESPGITCGNIATNTNLTNNISINGTSCFIITAANVTINCNRYSITGNETKNTIGILSNYSNTNIKDCIINGFDIGIVLNKSQNNTISGIQINTSVNNPVSPYYSSAIFINATSTILSNASLISNYGYGIYIYRSNSIQIINTTSISNTRESLYALGSTNTNMTASNITSAGNDGCYFDTGSNNNYVTNSIFNSPSNYAIYSANSHNTIIINSSSTSSSGNGLRFTSSNNNQVINSTLSSGSYAAWISDANNNSFFSITATATSQPAVYFANTYNSTILLSKITSNNHIGLLIGGSNNNHIDSVNITGKYSINGALTISSSTNNTISNSTINGLGSAYAISISGVVSNLNKFVNNTIFNATNSAYSDVNASNNIFYWNNFSNATRYVYDLNGSNNYNYSIDEQNEGNIYENVLNGTVNITGTITPTGFANLYIGNAGSNYPYNSTNSQGMFNCTGNCADYAPLTNQQTPQSTCQNISTSYTLTNNVSINASTCFTITAANVTLDCAGYSITGNNTFNTRGVYTDKFNSSVKNCNINGFDVGIYYNGADNGTISYNNVTTIVNNIVSTAYSSAIVLYNGANYNSITNNIANSTYGYGLYAYNNINNIIINSIFISTQNRGAFFDTQTYTLISNITGISNNSEGIYTNSGHNNTIQNSRGVSNIDSGFLAYNTHNITLSNIWGESITAEGVSITSCQRIICTNLTGNSNGSTGTYIAETSGNLLSGIYGTSNALRGIHLTNIQNSTISGIIGNSNNSDGTYFTGNQNTNVTDIQGISRTSQGLTIYSNLNHTITNAQGFSNSGSGIYLYLSHDIILLNATGISNTSYGFYSESSQNNTITGTQANSSSGVGLWISNGMNNRITGFSVKGTHGSYGAIRISGCQNNTISDSIANAQGTNYAMTLLSGGNQQNQFINNTFLNATTLVYLDSGAENNAFYWNNFTNTGNPTRYIYDLNGTNHYNHSVNGQNEGNVYENILNGSVQITGSVNSTYNPTLLLGASGTKYPYNKSNSNNMFDCNFNNCADYAPLTNQQANIILADCTGTDPLTNQDWIITDTTICQNVTINISQNRNITILQGANLTLYNVTLIMNPNANNNATINSTGYLNITRSNITSQGEYYNFIVSAGTMFATDNYFNRIGASWVSHQQGLHITTSNTTFRNNRITDGSPFGLRIIETTDVSLINTTIYNGLRGLSLGGIRTSIINFTINSIDYGIQSYGCTNCSVHGSTINTSGSEIAISCHQATCIDLIIDSTLYGKTPYYKITSGIFNVTFINTTMNKSGLEFATTSILGDYIIKNYLDIQVNYSNGTPAANANITAYDRNSVLQWSGQTNSLGYVRTNLTDFTLNASQNYTTGDVTWYSSYLVNASDGIRTALNNNVNMSTNQQIQLTLQNPERLSITTIYPTGNINATKNQFFNVTLNVSCDVGNCGEINVTLDPIDWGFSTHQFRKIITINASKVAENNINDFVLLLNLNDTDVTSKSLSLGQDLLFSYNESILDHEIEEYNSTTGKIVIWVRIPYLLNSTNMSIEMYYGDSDATSYENKMGVWNATYGMIYHFSNVTNTKVYDSTSYLVTGNKSENNPNATAGFISQGMSFDGINDVINVSSTASISDMNNATWSFWMKRQGLGPIMYKSDNNDDEGWWIDVRSTPDIGFSAIFGGGNLRQYTSLSLPAINEWSYVVFTWNGSNAYGSAEIFINGTKANYTPAGGNSGRSSDINRTLFIGTGGTGVSGYFNGTLDEIRLAKTIFTPGRIKTEYNNQYSPNTFYSVGEEEDKTLKGIIPIGTGTPFWTNASSNPLTINLNQSQSQIVTFWVNATGELNSIWDFFTYANITNDLSLGNTTAYFNVTIIEPGSIQLTSCGNLNLSNTNYVLTQNVTSNSTCFNITANNITLDGQGFSVNYSANGTAGYGVYTGHNSSTVKNLKIYEGTTTGSSKHAIYLNTASDTIVYNNSVFTIGSGSHGISTMYGDSNNISGNTVNSTGVGLYLWTLNTYAANNIITSTSYGIQIRNNHIKLHANKINSTSSGILLQYSTNATLTQNNVTSAHYPSYIFHYGASGASDYNHTIGPDNLAEGKPLNYTKYATNKVYDGVDFTNYGQVIFGWTNNITIKNSNFSSDSLMVFGSNVSIDGCVFNSDSYNALTMEGKDYTIINSNFNASCYGCYGISLSSTPERFTISNTNITTNSTWGSAIYLYSPRHGRISDLTVNTYSMGGHAVGLSQNSYNLTIERLSGTINGNILNSASSPADQITISQANMTITGGNSLLRYSAQSNITISDITITSTPPTTISIEGSGSGGTLNITNVTTDTGSSLNLSWTTGLNSTVNYGWWLDVQANYTNGQPALGVNISSYDNNGILKSSNTTESNGRTRQALLEYTRTGINGSTINYYSNYIINATLENQLISNTTNMSTNRQAYFTFEIDSTSPSIYFIEPTDNNSVTLYRNHTYINVSINDTSNTSAFIDWNRSLVGWWTFNENDVNSTHVFDRSGYDNDGTRYNTTLITGIRGQGLRFNGTTDYVKTPTSSSLNFTGELTVSTWIKLNSLDRMNIISHGEIFTVDASQKKWSLTYEGFGTGLLFGISNGSDGNLTEGYDLDIETWHHLAGTFDGTMLKLYVDGQLVRNASSPVSNLNSVIGDASHKDWLMFGSRPPGSVYNLNGSMDDALVFSRSLSALEIQALYNSTQYRLEQNFTNLANGDYSFKAYAQDTAGNVNETEERNITIETPYGLTINKIYPTSNINAAQNQFFNVTLNISCNQGNCGSINVTLDTSTGWWNSSWPYRIPFTANTTTNTPKGYQVRVFLNTTNVGSNWNWTKECINSSLTRARVTNSTGESELPFWIENCTTTNMTLWMKANENITSINSTYYLYYGNSEATPKSNGTATFEFFDDFSGDLSKWTRHITSGVYPQIESGTLVAGGGSSSGAPYGHTALGSNATYSNFTDGIIEGRLYAASTAIGEIGFRGSRAANTGYKSRFDARTGEGLSHLMPPYLTWNFLASCTASGTAIPTSSWQNFKITVVGSSFTSQAAGQTKTCSNTTYSSAGEISLQNHYGSSTTYDDVRVRKYTAVEPSVYLLTEESINKGIVPTTPGSTPFWTNATSNPIAINLNQSQSRIVTFWVNASGEINSAREFFAYATMLLTGTTNTTNRFNVTIIEYDIINPSIYFVNPTPNNSQTINNNYAYVNVSVTDTSNTSAFIDWNRSLVGWWRFNNEFGENSTFLKDWSSYSNNATCSGNYCPTQTTGKLSTGMSFIPNNTINISSPSSLDNIQNQGGGGMSIAFWVKVDSSTTSNILSKGMWSSGSGAWFVGKTSVTNPARLSFGKEGDTTDLTKSWNNVLVQDEWTHIVITWNGSMNLDGVNGYKNGVLLTQIGGTNGSTANSDASREMHIGSSNGNSEFFDGDLDDVMLFNRVISLEEIKSIYNSSQYRLERNFTNLADGNYSFKAYAQDTAGNVNETEERIIIISSSTELVNRCTVINSPGNYTQTANIIPTDSSTPCINISASNVTYNGNGYWIANLSFNNSALYSYGTTNITIMNVNVSTGNGTQYTGSKGVYLDATNVTLKNSVASHNYNGFFLRIRNSSVTNLRSFSNLEQGFELEVSVDSIYSNITAYNNMRNLLGNWGSNYVIGNTFEKLNFSSSSYCISLPSAVSHNKFKDSHLFCSYNFWFSGANNNTFNNFTIYGGETIETANVFNSIFTNFTVLASNTNIIDLQGAINNTFENWIVNSSNSHVLVLANPTAYGNLFKNITTTYVNPGWYHLRITAGMQGYNTFDNSQIGNYTINSSKLIIQTDYGRITFLEALNGSGSNFSNDVNIGYNHVYVNSIKLGLNKSANITLYNLPTNYANPVILRDGVECPATTCTNLTSLNAGNVTFNVTGWSNYSIGESLANYAGPAFSAWWNTSQNSTGSSNKTTIALPIYNGGTYNFSVDWGDGTTSIVTSWNDSDANHSYASEGTYQINITGTLIGFRFANTGDRLKIADISQWGILNVGNLNGYFQGCSNMNFIGNDNLNLTGTTTLYAMFLGATNFNGNISGWNTSQITSMYGTFSGATSFNQPIGNWNTSQVIFMNDMFSGATNFNQDISSWDTSKVNNMRYMFQNAVNFNQPIGNWNTSQVTTMYSMFVNADAFNQNISGWDTSKVNTMAQMFQDAVNFNQPIGNWNTSQVTDMAYMFATASAFNQNISGWDTHNVTNMFTMFHLATSFNQNLGSWNVSNVTNMALMFNGVTLSTSNYDALLNGWSRQIVKNNVNFSGGNSKYSCNGETARQTLITTYNWTITDGGYNSSYTCMYPGPAFSAIWNTSQTSAGSSNASTISLPIYNGGTYNFTVDWGDGNIGLVTSYNDPDATHSYAQEGTYQINITGILNGFRFNNGGDKLKIGNVNQWGILNVGNNNGYFYGCSNLNSSATDNLNLTGTTDLSWMFAGAGNFSGNISGWNTSQVTNMLAMFYYATSFNQPIGTWDTSKVTNMGWLFHSATIFNQNISLWNTGNVTTMDNMFRSAKAFNQSLDGWDTHNVTNMALLFDTATSFSQNIGSWNTSKVTNMYGMFWGASKFNNPIDSWDTSQVTNMSNMFSSTTKFNQNIGNWNVSNVSGMIDMFYGVTLSTSNYDALLNGWSRQIVKNNVTFSGGNSKYSCNGETARQTLITTYNWTITDGGYNSSYTCMYPGPVFSANWNTSQNSTGSSNTSSISLPLESSGTYNFTVDWGDGNIGLVTSYNDPDANHSYQIEGVYTVNISGTIVGFSFNNGRDRLKIGNIYSWGPLRLGNSGGYFYGCENMDFVGNDNLNLTETTTLNFAFRGATRFNGNISGWDTSQIVGLTDTFRYATNFNQDISSWNTQNITSLTYTFYDATSFNQPIGNWDISKVQSMQGTFYGAYSFNQNISGWNTSQVSNMLWMFFNAVSFNQSIGNWETGRVTTMNRMFSNAYAFNQDLSNWDVRNVTDMSLMFNAITLSTSNYDLLLNSWSSQIVKNNVTFSGGNSKYSNCTIGGGEAGRIILNTTYNWTITDGGLNATYVCPNTCTYSGSGNWNIDCSDNCIISSSVNLFKNNVTISGPGRIEGVLNITNATLVYILGGCQAFAK